MCCAFKHHNHYCSDTDIVHIHTDSVGSLFCISRHHQSPSWTVVCVNVKVIQSQSTSLKLIITQPFDFFFFLYCNQKTVYHFIKIVNTGYCTSKIPSRSLKKVPVRKRYGWVVGAPSALCRRSVFSSPWLHKM